MLRFPGLAHVAESAESSLFIADDEERLACYIGGEKSFRIGNGALRAIAFTAGVIQCADELPGAAENFVALDFEDCGVGVEARSESVRAFDLLVDVEMERFGGHGREFLMNGGSGSTWVNEVKEVKEGGKRRMGNIVPIFLRRGPLPPGTFRMSRQTSELFLQERKRAKKELVSD